MDRLEVGEVPPGERMVPTTPDTARPRARCSCCVDQIGNVASPFSGRFETDDSTARLKLDAVHILDLVHFGALVLSLLLLLLYYS